MSFNGRPTFCQHDIFVQACGKLQSFLGLLPRVVINCNVSATSFLRPPLSLLTSTLNVTTLPVPVEPDVWDQNVSIMRYEVLDNLGWAVLNIHVSPVDP
jgi:hypothetical protein